MVDKQLKLDLSSELINLLAQELNISIDKKQSYIIMTSAHQYLLYHQDTIVSKLENDKVLEYINKHWRQLNPIATMDSFIFEQWNLAEEE